MCDIVRIYVCKVKNCSNKLKIITEDFIDVEKRYFKLLKKMFKKLSMIGQNCFLLCDKKDIKKFKLLLNFVKEIEEANRRRKCYEVFNGISFNNLNNELLKNPDKILRKIVKLSNIFEDEFDIIVSPMLDVLRVKSKKDSFLNLGILVTYIQYLIDENKKK